MKRYSLPLSFILLIVFVLPVLASNGGVSLSTTRSSMNLDDTITLTAITSSENIVRWESTDPSVASVSPYGVVTSHKAGVATISATITSGERSECTVTVRSKNDIEYTDTRLKYPNGDELSSLMGALIECGYKTDFETLYGMLPHGSLPFLDVASGLRFAGDPWNSFVGEPSVTGYGCYVTCLVGAVEQIYGETGIDYTFGYNSKVSKRDYLTDNSRYSFVSGDAFSALAESAVDSGNCLLFWGTYSRDGEKMGKAESSLIWFTEDDRVSFTSVLNCDVLLMTGYDDQYYYFNDPIYGKDQKATRASVEDAYESLYSQYLLLTPAEVTVQKPFTVSDNRLYMPPDTIQELKVIGTDNAIFESSDESIATVDNNGLITTLNPGTATITVSSSGFIAYVRVICSW